MRSTTSVPHDPVNDSGGQESDLSACFWYMTALLGPKSQNSRSSSFSVGRTLLWYCTYMSAFKFNINAPWWHPEGSNSAIGVGGVFTDHAPASSPSWTKQDGFDPPTPSALHKNRNHQVCRKKPYIRALKRATLHGMTWYRGKYMTATQLGATAQPWSLTEPMTVQASPDTQLTGSHTSPNRRPSGKFRQNRLSFFSWNMGQLSLTKWDLFRAWLHHQPIDCACLQDTGWKLTGEWQDQQFSYLHSGAANHRGGL